MLAYFADISVKSGVTGVVQLVSTPIAEQPSKNFLNFKVKFLNILKSINWILTCYIASAHKIGRFDQVVD